jgi:NTP pyrophosphatase (non-canonical NTP hydrolase)
MAMTANGLAKLLEELGELSQVAAKKLAYFHTDEHPDGAGSLKGRLEQEMGDVIGAIYFVADTMGLDVEAIARRRDEKLNRFHQWHADASNGGDSFESTGQDAAAPAPVAQPLTLENAPLGTKAPASGGGHWTRVERGWKWCTGATFPRPGGDWTGKFLPPDAAPAPVAQGEPVACVSDEQIDEIFEHVADTSGSRTLRYVAYRPHFRQVARLILALAAPPAPAPVAQDERDAENELNCAEEVLDALAADLNMPETSFDCIGDYIEAVVAAIRAAPAPVAQGEPVAKVDFGYSAGPMNAERAAYFLRRFESEENLLGPNERAAVEFAIAAIAPMAQPLTTPKDKPGATFVDGYGYVDTAAVRAIERAHGIEATGQEGGA